MGKLSAGLMMYRIREGRPEVLLVHLGGPYWAKKDRGAWFIPKGELHPGEDELAAAQREFQEETGLRPGGPFFPLGRVQQKSGKQVAAWAFEGDWDPSLLRSNTFPLEWPPRSGKMQPFPEVDRAEFFAVAAARDKVHSAEWEFLVRLEEMLSKKDANA